jgi:hypothetical protein
VDLRSVVRELRRYGEQFREGVHVGRPLGEGVNTLSEPFSTKSIK